MSLLVGHFCMTCGRLRLNEKSKNFFLFSSAVSVKRQTKHTATQRGRQEARDHIHKENFNKVQRRIAALSDESGP